MRTALMMIVLPVLLFAIEPVRKIPLAGNAIDVAAVGGILVTGGDAGMIELFKSGETKPFKKVKLAEVESAFGKHPPKIYSVDRSGSGALLAVSEGNADEGRILTLYDEKGAAKILIAAKDRLLLRKARFVGADRIFIMEVGGIARLIDLGGKTLYEKPIMGSSFSDFALSPDQKTAAITGESGEVVMFDLQKGQTLRRYTGVNKDNVYRIDWKSGFMITAGQDRIAAIYDAVGGQYEKRETPFLISAAGLSPSANRLAYVLDESGAIGVFERKSGRELARLKGHYALIGTILFLDENRLITGGDDNFLLEWRIP